MHTEIMFPSVNDVSVELALGQKENKGEHWPVAA